MAEQATRYIQEARHRRFDERSVVFRRRRRESWRRKRQEESTDEVLQRIVELGFAQGVEKLVKDGGTLRANGKNRVDGEKRFEPLKVSEIIDESMIELEN